MTDPTLAKQQATEIKLYGLLANWHQLNETQLSWLIIWFAWEIAERKNAVLNGAYAVQKSVNSNPWWILIGNGRTK